MPTCLYCRAPTTGEEGRAHILPEAIVGNDFVMPLGAVCDACNNYLGQLDSALVNHPLVSFGIQTFGLPGKRGKPRNQLGWFERLAANSTCDLKISARGVKVTTYANDKLLIGVQPTTGADRARFHRALYHVAFNLVASCATPDQLLESQYDQVRRYIREPRPGEIWPYFHAVLAPTPLDFIHLSVLKGARAQVALFLFNQGFAVDLLQTGTLQQQLMAWAPNGVNWSEVS